MVVGRLGWSLLQGRHLVALKQTHAEEQGQGHLPLHRTQDAGIALDGAELALQGGQPPLLHQIALVQQQQIAVEDLGAGHLPLQQLFAEVLRIHQGDDRIQAGEIPQITAQEGHRHRQGIRQAGGFHHQVVHRLGALQDSVYRIEKLAIDGATDAAVAELHHLVTGGHHQIVVDADLPEFVHQHRRAQALLVGEDVVQQGGFSGSKEARKDRHR